jgi:CBS domain-containing protein
MKIMNSNIINYHSYNTEKIVDNKKSSELVKNDNSDKIYKKISEDTFKNMGPNAPKAVKDAWEKTLEETGAYDLGRDENGVGYITQMDILRAIKRAQNESYDILGNSVDSAVEAVNLALSMLKNPITPETDPQKIKRQEKEKEFYEAFLKNLNQI